MIPSKPTDPPTQNPPSGWSWEFAGRTGREASALTYAMVPSASTAGYFIGPAYRASSDQYHGQDSDKG